MAQQHYLAEVRDQYEDYPYPHRNPEDEKRRLLATFTDTLDLINYHCFEGKQSFEDNFRVLVAGGGTGDATIYLAEQLKHTNAQIVHLDISSTSIAVAEERVRIRGLKNVTFVNESLLDVARLGLEKFDYINCTGVLHHLESPAQGLESLKSVLKDSGAMALMLYAPYGRTGIYMVQDIMRTLTGHIPDKQYKVNIARKVLDSLPQQHLFSGMKHMVEQEIATEKDAGIYDLFLHSQDRPYNVEEVYALLDEAGMSLLEFIFVAGIGKSLYDPLNYIRDEKLRVIISQKDQRTRHALAELITGNMTMHSFYCAKTPRPKPSPQSMDVIPLFNVTAGSAFANSIVTSVAKAPVGGTLTIQHNGAILTTCVIETRPYSAGILKRIDGKARIGDILQAVANEHSTSVGMVQQDWLATFSALNLHDWLLLKV